MTILCRSQDNEGSVKQYGGTVLRCLLVAIVLIGSIGIGIYLMMPVLPVAGEPARQYVCMDNLNAIAEALNTYRKMHGRFPPRITMADNTERRLHSWRVLLLPYLGEEELYGQLRLDEPWNSKHNWALLARSKAGLRFHCPSDSHEDSDSDAIHASYMMVLGYPIPSTPKDSAAPSKGMVDAHDVPLVVEVTNSGIHWAEPRDLDNRTPILSIESLRDSKVNSNHDGGAHVLYSNGHVQFWRGETGEMGSGVFD